MGALAPGLKLEVIARASFIIGYHCVPAAWHALSFSAKPLRELPTFLYRALPPAGMHST